MALKYPKNVDRLFAGLPEKLPAYCGDFDETITFLNTLLDNTGSLAVLTLGLGNGTAWVAIENFGCTIA